MVPAVKGMCHYSKLLSVREFLTIRKMLHRNLCWQDERTATTREGRISHGHLSGSSLAILRCVDDAIHLENEASHAPDSARSHKPVRETRPRSCSHTDRFNPLTRSADKSYIAMCFFRIAESLIAGFPGASSAAFLNSVVASSCLPILSSARPRL
jgi:hypothetical protein